MSHQTTIWFIFSLQDESLSLLMEICVSDDVVQVFVRTVLSHKGEQQRALYTALGNPSVHNDDLRDVFKQIVS